MKSCIGKLADDHNEFIHEPKYLNVIIQTNLKVNKLLLSSSEGLSEDINLLRRKVSSIFELQQVSRRLNNHFENAEKFLAIAGTIVWSFGSYMFQVINYIFQCIFR